MSVLTFSGLKDFIMRASIGYTLSRVIRDLVDSIYPGTPQELTASGAVTEGKKVVELNHASVVIEATIEDAANHSGLFVVSDTAASGTAAHTLTLTSGTFDGTNNVATLDAPGELLVVYFDTDGKGTIVQNTGSVALS